MTRLTKALLGISAAIAVLASTGCCLPLHGGHHGGGHWDRQDGRDRWSSDARPAPPSRPPQRWR